MSHPHGKRPRKELTRLPMVDITEPYTFDTEEPPYEWMRLADSY